MLTTTKGIVFHQLKYSETSVIAKIYTEIFGLQSYLIKGARSKKSKISPALLQHLSLVELVSNHKEKSNLQHIRELRSSHQYSSIPFDIVKSSITVFVNELCYKAIQEEESNPKLFKYIYNAMQWLDLTENDFINFHLIFGIKLTTYLGFYPRGVYSPVTSFFDLEEGSFVNVRPYHSNYIVDGEAQLFSDLTEYTFENLASLKLDNQKRNLLLDYLIQYYQLHLPNFGNMKSPEVLRTVLS
ncbi:MAG: DNA repair protein RecO [Clostridia bacterium]|nr:DNA repair protein RecO [Clostridia bacterium]